MKHTKKSYTPSGPPDTFTALFTLPGGTTRRLPQCKVWNGVVVQLVSVGQGKKNTFGGMTAEGEGESWEEWEYYAYLPRPIYCKSKQTPEQIKEITEADGRCGKKKDWTECFEKYRFAMFTMGDNGNGYKVENLKEVEEREVIENRTATLAGGFRGFKIDERLPSELWNRLRPYAKFYKKADIEEYYEDMDDFGMVDMAWMQQGWNYSREVIGILVSLGWTVLYCQRPITSYEDTDRVDKELRQEAEQKREIEEEKNRQQKAILAQYRDALGQNGNT